MSERFEQSINEWYASSPSANLDYLDLSNTSKPSNSQLAQNLSITYDRVNLLSRYCQSKFASIQNNICSQNHQLNQAQETLSKILKAVAFVEQEVTTGEAVTTKSQKIITEQFLSLIRDLDQSLKGLHQEVKEIKRSVAD